MKSWIFPFLLLLGVAAKSQETRIKLYPNAAASFDVMYGINVGFSLFPDKVLDDKFFGANQYLNIEVRTTFGRYGEWSADYQKYMGANLEFHYAIEVVRFFSYFGVLGVNNEQTFIPYFYEDVTYDPATDTYVETSLIRNENEFWNPSALFSGGVGIELKAPDGNVFGRISMGFPEFFNLGVGVAF